MTMNNSENSSPYHAMESALYYLADHHDNPPSLKELAAQCDLSEFHFQKQFRRWVGISPKRFNQYLSKEYLKSLLDSGLKPLDACYQAGLSGPGRMHELFINTIGMTPAQYSKRGQDMIIQYGFHDSPFGPYLLGVTEKGICHMSFIESDENLSLQALTSIWPGATFIEDQASTQSIHEQIFNSQQKQASNLTLLLKGTNFQIQVWQALLRIPIGRISSYEDLANLTGKPSATRACASAIARNNIAWLIPCHRVVRKIGDSGKYRWGANRKKLIIAYECAAQNQ